MTSEAITSQKFDKLSIAQRLATLSCDPVEILADMATNEHVEADIRVKCAVKLLDAVIDKDTKVEEETAPGATTNLILNMQGVPANGKTVRQD